MKGAAGDEVLHATEGPTLMLNAALALVGRRPGLHPRHAAHRRHVAAQPAQRPAGAGRALRRLSLR